MKNLVLSIVLNALIPATLANANCTLLFNYPEKHGMHFEITTAKSIETMKKILSKKGYEVYEQKELNGITPAYTFNYQSSWGYPCATGLKWYDYLAVPASYSFQLQGPGLDIAKDKDFNAPVGVQGMARKSMMRNMRQLPECPSVDESNTKN